MLTLVTFGQMLANGYTFLYAYIIEKRSYYDHTKFSKRLFSNKYQRVVSNEKNSIMNRIRSITGGGPCQTTAGTSRNEIA